MRILIATIVLALCVPFTSYAQEKDPVKENLFPPELIMANQNAIGLTDGQKNSIKELMKKSQSEFMDLNWKMQELATGLVEIIAKTKIDESKALAQLDKVLNQENKIKKKQLALMVGLKNLLTDEQQEKLKTFR